MQSLYLNLSSTSIRSGIVVFYIQFQQKQQLTKASSGATNCSSAAGDVDLGKDPRTMKPAISIREI